MELHLQSGSASVTIGRGTKRGGICVYNGYYLPTSPRRKGRPPRWPPESSPRFRRPGGRFNFAAWQASAVGRAVVSHRPRTALHRIHHSRLLAARA